jgi:gliding motility-associated-like protein
MRPIILKLLFPALVVLFSLSARAQICNGSLGDPVINQDFGSGTNPGPQLAAGITNMTYTSNNDPADGQYTIATSLTGANNTHSQTWWDVPSDHTGNPNGYMMIVNASYQPSIFFYQQANGLCPSTTYYFSAYILNLMIPGPITANYTHPDITFSVETTSGQLLAPPGDTHSIPASQNGPQWVQYGVSFTTPANVTDVVVVMTNNAPGGNGNDFILDDITFRACGPIIREGFSSAAGPKALSLCQGASANVSMQAQVAGNGTPVYQWQANPNNAGWNDMPGYTSNTANVPIANAKPGQYQYRLGVANGSAISVAACRVYAPPLTVYVNPLPVVPAIADQAVCEGSPFQITASGGSSYTWNGPGIASSTQNPLVIANAAAANSGIYTVVAMSDSGCTSTPVTTKITVLPKIIPVVSSDATVCAGESTKLSASGGTHYQWSPSTWLDNDTIANPTATPLQTTAYKVSISNGACVDSSKTVTVTVYQNPVANAGNPIFLFEGQSAILHGSVKGDNITGYYWTPATFLSDPTSLTPIATPADNITYTLTAASSACGTSTSSVFVRVYQKVTIPNTFSPNGDGINDLWNIDALITYPEARIQVFDRYGQSVYQSTGYSKPWDGTSNGKQAPAGTYYYIIDLKNTTPKLSGWVLIVR